MNDDQPISYRELFSIYKRFAIFDNSPILVWIKDISGKYLYINNHFCEYNGKSRKDIINSTDFELWPNEFAEKYVSDDKDVVKLKHSLHFEEKVISKGEEHWMTTYKNPVLNDRKEVIGIFGFSINITEKKNFEKTLVENQNKLVIINNILAIDKSEVSNEQLLIQIIDEIFKFYNTFRISYFEIDSAYCLNKMYSINPEDLPFLDIEKKSVVNPVDYITQLDNAGYFIIDNFESSNKTHLNNQESSTNEVASTIDIAIRINNIVVGVLRFESINDFDWNQTKINNLLEIGIHISTLLKEMFLVSQMKDYENQLKNNVRELNDYIEEINELKDLYQTRNEEMQINRQIMEEKAYEMILLNEQLINKEQELSETNTKLESSLKERDKFFSIIAHDLRGPIGSFLGLTKMVTEQSSEFTKEELLEISDMLYKSADTLYNLMENLLNWSRLQRDVIIVEPIPIKVETVINLSLSIYNDAINKKNIEVSKHILKDISALSDLNMLQSVIRNLLSNAIKFTPLNGKIIIESKKIDANFVSIAIQDSGIGMSEDLVSKLFKIDEKVSREGTEGEPSTGLGLILCKEFVEKNKGSISVVSQENKGTKFEIILPIGIEE